MIKIIGLTGRSGAGKGYVSDHFARIGIGSIDTDRVSRIVTGPGSPCLMELAEHFGDDIIDNDGSLKRRELASLAFSSPEETAVLNSITHKYILSETRRMISEAGERGEDLIIVDAPQLFESGFDKLCDVTVGVIADDDICLERIIKRDGINENEAKKRLSRQFTNEYFIERCDYIIINNNKEDIAEAVRRIAIMLKSE